MLTHTAVEAAKPKAKPYKLSDGNGLYLLIETGGSKLWRFRYQFDRKEKMLSLGSFPAVTIAQARTKRDEAKAVLASGVDPARKREQDRITAQINAANTFGAIASEYIARLEQEGASESAVSKNRWLLEHLASPLSKRPIADITSAEILQLLQRIEKSGRRDTAHRLRGTLGSVFRFAVRTLRAPMDPTVALKGALLKVEVFVSTLIACSRAGEHRREPSGVFVVAVRQAAYRRAVTGRGDQRRLRLIGEVEILHAFIHR